MIPIWVSELICCLKGEQSPYTRGVEFSDSPCWLWSTSQVLTHWLFSVRFWFTEMFTLFSYLTISFLKYFIDHCLTFGGVCVRRCVCLCIFYVWTHKPPALKSYYIHYYAQAKPWPSLFPMCIYLPISVPFSSPNAPSLFDHSVKIYSFLPTQFTSHFFPKALKQWS